jgi:tetraacyldisaccharide 4'-kinase
VEIVDLRPVGERRARELWARPPSPPRRALAALAGRVADGLAARRAGGRGPLPAHTFVVSVGNLRVGGTGKTPVTARLATDLAAAGLRGAVLVRGYGSAAAGPLLVEADDAAAGDEARLLAGRIGSCGWDVIQARRRAAGLAHAMARTPRPEVVIVEDGHQTAAVPRHLDVLILDRWETTTAGVVARAGLTLPWGPYRESARGAERAGVWLLETACPPAAAVGARPIVCGFAREVALDARDEGDDAVGLVSGLALPEGFEAACARALGRAPRLSVRCADHCQYDDGLLDRVLAAGRGRGVARWITTEKDWVKLQLRWPVMEPLTVARLEVSWTSAPALSEVVLEERRRWRAEGRATSC